MKSTQLKKDDIESLEIRDFKSIGPAQRVTFGALTVLAGANSTGKSTLMQPILLLKQTLDSSYDEGPLRLDGPNVFVKSASRLISKVPGVRTDGFEFCFGLVGGGRFRLGFSYKDGQGLDVELMEGPLPWGKPLLLQKSMTAEALLAAAPSQGFIDAVLTRDRCFLDVELRWPIDDLARSAMLSQLADCRLPILQLLGAFRHLPAFRGSPGGIYPVANVSPVSRGTFENYTASIIHQWQVAKDSQKLKDLFRHLIDLGLTWTVRAVAIGETSIELHVGRLPLPVPAGRDLVPIADVGFGVSQALPIAVALVAAEPGDWIYVEEPESHLHPRAQARLASLFADAALRGVRVVIETHSSILLRSIQTLVAKDVIDKKLVNLHWCTRDPKTGATNVQLADLQDDGSFGEWPEDFADVEMEVERAYLDAASARHS